MSFLRVSPTRSPKPIAQRMTINLSKATFFMAENDD